MLFCKIAEFEDSTIGVCLQLYFFSLYVIQQEYGISVDAVYCFF